MRTPAEYEQNHDDPFESRLDSALAARPQVAVPPAFAAQVARLALEEQRQPARPRWRWPLGWGLTVAAGGLAILLVLMVSVAEAPLRQARVPAQITLCLEFVILLLAMTYLHHALE